MNAKTKHGKCSICASPEGFSAVIADSLCWVCRRLRNAARLDLQRDLKLRGYIDTPAVAV